MKPATRISFVTVVALGASIFLSASASATELSDFLEKFHPTDPCDWSGFYIGFNNGATFTHFDVSKHMTDVNLEEQFYELIPEVTGDEIGIFTTFHPSGHHDTDVETIGGGQTGFKFQFGSFVLGAEGGFQGNGSETTGKSTEFQENELFLITEQSFVTADTKFTSMQKVETLWNAHVGGNIGFCWKGFLIYGEGGVAFTDAHFSNTDKADTSFFGFIGDGGGGATVTAGDIPRIRRLVRPAQELPFIGEVTDQKTHTQGDVLTGWYGGGGVAYLLTNLVSVGFDYKHIEWGDVTEHQMEGGGPVFPNNGKLDLSADQVTFQVNIKVGSMPFGGH